MEIWKTLAIIFITLFIIETAVIGWSIYIVGQEEKEINECYYNICDGYVEALYNNGVCYCYDTDMLGELKVAKTEYMRK